MKKLFFLFSLITIVGLWATPLNKQVKTLRKDIAEHGKSEVESWKEIERIDKRLAKLEKHFADGPRTSFSNIEYGDNGEDEEDEDE